MERNAVVTGAARGIGAAIATALAADGVRVAAVDRDSPDTTVAAIRGAGGVCEPVVADVATEGGAQTAAAAARAALGPVGVLVNNAAALGSTSIFDLDYGAWRRMLTTNLDSQFLMVKAVLEDMLGLGWGRIVNVASSSLLTSTPGLTAYMTSKGGVLGLTSALANDLGRHGITVNAVSPGLTRTPGVEADIDAGVMPASALDDVVLSQAVPRPGVPEDVAGTVVYLASESASFVTAQFIVVDGGATRR
ncbi:MAG TPA: SDR family oxidoreductase [Gaiellaceae bacterium]|nr:SDR family oxidoreductase [Gaiellaceae bacterium]